MSKKRAGTPFNKSLCGPNKCHWGHYEDAEGPGIPKGKVGFKRCAICGITKFYKKDEETLELFKDLLALRGKRKRIIYVETIGDLLRKIGEETNKMVTEIKRLVKEKEK